MSGWMGDCETQPLEGKDLKTEGRIQSNVIGNRVSRK